MSSWPRDLWTIRDVALYWGVSESRARAILAENEVRAGYDPETVRMIRRGGRGTPRR